MSTPPDRDTECCCRLYSLVLPYIRSIIIYSLGQKFQKFCLQVLPYIRFYIRFQKILKFLSNVLPYIREYMVVQDCTTYFGLVWGKSSANVENMIKLFSGGWIWGFTKIFLSRLISDYHLIRTSWGNFTYFHLIRTSELSVNLLYLRRSVNIWGCWGGVQ